MFKSDKLTIDEHGINIISNYLPKEHIDFSKISGIKIRREYRLKYWYLVLLVGVGIAFIFSLLFYKAITEFHFKIGVATNNIRGLLILWIVLIILVLFGTFKIPHRKRVYKYDSTGFATKEILYQDDKVELTVFNIKTYKK